MAGISLKNVYKIFPGDVTAVHDFSLEIEDKEFIILVGPSGCGKSTMLRMIAGIESITEGEIYIGDKYVNNVPAKDRDISMVFQNYALFPHMNVFRNISFGLQIRKVPKSTINEKVQETANILGIEQLLRRKPRQLSGGERQRVALGRAMVRDPAVFLLDEPLSNLDAKHRMSMRTEISTLHKRLDATFVYVTHDQTEAMTMGDRIVVMKDGFIQQVDTPQNLYKKPCNMFVAGFIGSPQINLIDAKVVKTSVIGYAAKFGDMELPLLPSVITHEMATKYEGKDVVIGIRAENLHTEYAHMNQENICSIPAEVTHSELLGSETYLYCDCNKIKLIAAIPPDNTPEIGKSIEIGFDCTKLHIFDKDSGYVIE